MTPDNTKGIAAATCERLFDEVTFRIDAALKSRGPDEVHDLRVAIRRLSQALRHFEFCFSAHSASKIRTRLKKMMHLAGEVRNLDVAMDYLHHWHVRDQDQLEEHRTLAAASLVSALNKWLDRGRPARLKEELGLRSLKQASMPLEPHAREILSAMAADFFAHGNRAAEPHATPAQLHAFRIAAKKFRYSMELFADPYGHILNARIAQVKDLQSILGAINDCETLLSIISGDSAAARLRKRQQRKVEEFRRHWSATFAVAATAESWVATFSLLSLRKGPGRERECHRAGGGVRTIRLANRRHTTGG